MSWNKLGYFYVENDEKKFGIHIDHIIPICCFDLSDPRELFLCFHWKNCQPLWGDENMKKRNFYDEKQRIKYFEEMKNEIGNYKLFQQIINCAKQRVDKQLKNIEFIDNHDLEAKKKILDEYTYDQCLEAIQIMFFMHENKIAEKNYKVTPFALMKNKESRKSGSENPRSKKVCKVSLDGQLLSTYESMNQAAKINNTFHASISKCCSKPEKIYISGGFYWCFEDDLYIILFRSRFVRVKKQLLEKIPKYQEPRKYKGRVQTDESRKKIAESIKIFYKTEEGKKSKKKAFEKRSETMNARHEQK
jgi:hypothetical protein